MLELLQSVQFGVYPAKSRRAAQKNSEGTRLTKVAEAEGEKLKNEAIQGAGGSVIVALEAARNLQIGNVVISTIDVDLLDVDAMATKLGVEEKK